MTANNSNSITMTKISNLQWLLIFVCILFTLNIHAQFKSGVVAYEVIKIGEIIDFKDNEGVQSLANRISEISKDFVYKLSFNESESIFELLPVMTVGKNDMYLKAAKSILNGNNVYYVNKNKEVLITQKNIFGEQYLITENYSDFEWQITNETKKIDEFTCYKAIGFRISTTREMKQKKVQKIAWFCPELPNIYGPFESVGLPGLVLEFQVGQYSFVARKIIKAQEPIIIEKPNTGKKITRQELNAHFYQLANEQDK
jgi:GLPGLI family protein